MAKNPVRNYLGLDVLRGLGIFVLLWMHTAFYFYDGLYDIDFDNPPAIVTIIGLLLMFAGVFAMISGTAHVVQYHAKTVQRDMSGRQLLRYNGVNGLLMLAVAWIYFLFTGPGLVNMEARDMNNSLLVDLLRNGSWRGFTMERFLYVDSLVMIGMNLLLLAPMYLLFRRLPRRLATTPWLIGGLGLLALSLIRIPLYELYLQALEDQRWGPVLALNWLVNKNNPLLPYLSFSMLGGWIGALLLQGDTRKLFRHVLPVGIFLFLAGAVLYVLLPDTMLQRSIDGKWFAIMTAQLGLFLLLVLLFLGVFDLWRSDRPVPFQPLVTFFRRFGIAGLTPFFLESIVSALMFRLLKVFFPELSFGLGAALAYGLLLALIWGGLLRIWERHGYRYGLEFLLCRLLEPFGHSAKADKLSEGSRNGPA